MGTDGFFLRCGLGLHGDARMICDGGGGGLLVRDLNLEGWALTQSSHACNSGIGDDGGGGCGGSRGGRGGWTTYLI